MRIEEQEKRKRKKKSDGWSWFERVKINPGDETIPLATFNNSVDFNAATSDGGNLVGANCGMSMGEALDVLDNLDDKSLGELLALYYKDILSEYVDVRSRKNRAGNTKFSLQGGGYKPSGEINRVYRQSKDRKTEIENSLVAKLPDGYDIKKLAQIYQKLAQNGGIRDLTEYEIKDVENALLQAQYDKFKPSENQLFRFSDKFSYIKPFVVDKVDKNIVYYRVDGGYYQQQMDLGEFLELKKQGKIKYIR